MILLSMIFIIYYLGVSFLSSCCCCVLGDFFEVDGSRGENENMVLLLVRGTFGPSWVVYLDLVEEIDCS